MYAGEIVSRAYGVLVINLELIVYSKTVLEAYLPESVNY